MRNSLDGTACVTRSLTETNYISNVEHQGTESVAGERVRGCSSGKLTKLYIDTLNFGKSWIL